MARIKWVQDRLEEWGRWCRQSESGSLGFPRQSAFVRLGPSSGRNECVVPTISIQASEIDDAVKSLQLSQSHLFLVVKLTYADGLPRDQVARKMRKAESTISHNLGLADLSIKRWLDEKKSFTP